MLSKLCTTKILLQAQGAQAGVGWARTKAWVETAAAEAPMTTEALLHSFITSSDNLPGATAPAWLRDDRPSSPRMGECDLLGHARIVHG